MGGLFKPLLLHLHFTSHLHTHPDLWTNRPACTPEAALEDVDGFIHSNAIQVEAHLITSKKASLDRLKVMV